VSTLRAIEQELIFFRILVTGSVEIFRRIPQSNSFPCAGDLRRGPDGDTDPDNVDCERVHIVGIASEELGCKRRHVDGGIGKIKGCLL